MIHTNSWLFILPNLNPKTLEESFQLKYMQTQHIDYSRWQCVFVRKAFMNNAFGLIAVVREEDQLDVRRSILSANEQQSV